MTTILIRTLLVYIILIFSMRLLGKRQIGEIELSEFVITIMLSELAVSPILEPERPILNTILPIAILISLEVLFTYLETKSIIVKRILTDEPSLLIKSGRLDQKELGRMRLTVEELLSLLRLKDVADISDVNYAILEKNGQLSVFPKSDKAGIMHPLIIDGVFLDTPIADASLSRKEILRELSARNCHLENTFLFAVDDNGKFTLIKKER